VILSSVECRSVNMFCCVDGVEEHATKTDYYFYFSADRVLLSDGHHTALYRPIHALHEMKLIHTRYIAYLHKIKSVYPWAHIGCKKRFFTFLNFSYKNAFSTFVIFLKSLFSSGQMF